VTFHHVTRKKKCGSGTLARSWVAPSLASAPLIRCQFVQGTMAGLVHGNARLPQPPLATERGNFDRRSVLLLNPAMHLIVDVQAIGKS